MSTGAIEFLGFWGFILSVIFVGLQIYYNRQSIKTQLEIAQKQNETQLELFRKEVLSKSRQEWINVLRNNVAELVSLITPIVTFDPDDAEDDPEYWGKFDEDWRKAEYSAAKIELLLNVNEPQHNEISELVITLREAMIELHEKKSKRERKQIEDKIFNLADKLFPATQRVLKAEWERVKRGE